MSNRPSNDAMDIETRSLFVTEGKERLEQVKQNKLAGTYYKKESVKKMNGLQVEEGKETKTNVCQQGITQTLFSENPAGSHPTMKQTVLDM